jgi:hypothetical protein
VTLVGVPVAAEPSAQDRERARSLMDLGDKNAAAGDLEGALKAYQAADGIMRVPTTGLEVGRTQEKLGRLIEARDAFIAVTRFPAQTGEPAAFTKARDTAKRLSSELGPRIPSLVLRLSGPPAGTEVEVSLDDKRLSAELVGLPISVNPGRHRLVARANGFQPAERELNVVEAETKEVALTLSPAEAAGTPGATLPAATTAAAEEKPGPSRTLMWVGFGVGAAGVATGAVTGVLSLSKTNQAKKLCDGSHCPSEAQGDIDSATTLANVANVAFAVGVVGLGVGVWQLLTTGGSSSETSTASRAFHAEPLIGLGSVGIAGSFE